MVQPDLGLASVPVLDQVQVSTTLGDVLACSESQFANFCSLLFCNQQLPRSCQTLKCRSGNKEQTIYIVGTAHVSAASCDDVRAVIRAVKPEVVLVSC